MPGDERIVMTRPGRASELLALLEAHGYAAAKVSSGAEARRLLDDGEVAVVVLERGANEDERTLLAAQRLRAALQAAKVGLWDWELGTDRVFYSREWKRQLGYGDAELGDSFEEWRSRVHPDDLETAMAEIHRYLADRSRPYEAEFRMRHKDGGYRWILAQASVERGIDDRGQRMRGSHVDITDRKRVQLALADSEARLRHVADAVPHLIWELSPTGAMRYANRALREYFGHDAITLDDWSALIHPDDFPSAEALLARAMAVESGGPLIPLRLRRHDGSYRWFANHAAVVRGDDGELRYIVGSSTDIHDLKQTRDMLAESQQRLIAALEAAGMGTWRWDIDRDRVSVDPSLAGLLGLEPGSVANLRMADVLGSSVHPDDRRAAERELRRVLGEGPGAELTIEWRVQRHDGEPPQWLATKGRMLRDEQNGHRVLIGATADITRRRVLEAQLHQAKKMEAIGLLAGGVAHDFNNILTVVLGHASMLEAHPRLPDELQTSVHEIVLAAEQAAGLTNQLLAFGRRQVLQRRDIDLNLVVTELLDLVRRLLGPRVTCVFAAASAPVLVHADRSMLTQVLLNLVVNARDAMAGEGRLTIATQVGPLADAPGQWAQIEVEDSGRGIEPTVLPHIFEPFFTTKSVSQGTGLGLATVYGIVEQHRGTIRVTSELGVGTRFVVALPLVEP